MHRCGFWGCPVDDFRPNDLNITHRLTIEAMAVGYSIHNRLAVAVHCHSVHDVGRGQLLAS